MVSTQTIPCGALADRTSRDADFTVSASASSGLPVAFGATGNGTVSGGTVHITGAGSLLDRRVAVQLRRCRVTPAAPEVLMGNPASTFAG